ncbi:U3 small nucleolar RNA-associated protein 14 homolog A [Coffea eugenioides]|uniref:U3 small nucleolar RNA-associated protein 14 homolog A n=1 Tax=Coffea eugenioides TaxID=49369 RepID=UPI000F60C08A|nr:U3 small nucleolar RNA-associated protein 14 homolog A [Coffea eugenioides]
MAEKKRKKRDENGHKNRGEFKKKKKNGRNSSKQDREARRRTGPRLPNALRKELDLLNSTTQLSDDDAASDSDVAATNDLYEYEEALPEEESKKNKRFDSVDNYEYELPEEFEDEDVASDDGNDEGDEANRGGDELDNEDDGRHSRMLQEITGLPGDAFEGKRKNSDFVISEAYPESEYNPSRDILEGDSRISIEDLLDPLHGKSGFSKLRKDVHRMERKSLSLNAPLPRSDQERLERKAAYELSKKDITKWEPLVKRNREAPTIYFDEETDVGFSTVGSIASEFKPRSVFEKKIASLVNDNDIIEAHRKDGARLLELNKISVEDVRDQQNRLAKMRSLLFRHELKAKRIRKIKSKTYHRLLKKDRLKATAAAMEMDPEAAKELAMKQEFKRAEERLTLKHKNSSKWAKRILQRGLNIQDDGTRAAIAEQLNQHALLTRKMNSMMGSSDESSDEDYSDDILIDSDQEGPSTMLKKAKEKTLEILEGNEELPKSGVLSLPFMVRGLKKRKEAADEEARLALQDYELSLKQLEDKNEEDSENLHVSSGRRVFGATKRQVQEFKDKNNSDNYYGNSDSDEGLEAIGGDEEDGMDKNNESQTDVNINPDVLREESEIGHDPIFKSFEDIVKEPGPRTTYEVALFASNSSKKMKNVDEKIGVQNEEVSDCNTTRYTEMGDLDMEGENADSDTESEGQMVDGILSSGTKSTYEQPSQEELIRRAFAGDDVEEEFEKDKEVVLNEENPEPEKPTLLPGWGQWTHIQKSKGLPSWMMEEHENAKKKREEALKKRRDAQLNHVIISEKLDKKAEKLHMKTLPFPYTSKEVFEQSMRMPIGPEFNPATAIGALNRPEVVKKAGLIIKPIRLEDVDPHEKVENNRSKRQKQQMSKSKGKSNKNMKSRGP